MGGEYTKLCCICSAEIKKDHHRVVLSNGDPETDDMAHICVLCFGWGLNISRMSCFGFPLPPAAPQPIDPEYEINKHSAQAERTKTLRAEHEADHEE